MNEHILYKLFTLILFIGAKCVKMVHILQLCIILRQFNFLPKFLHHFQFVTTIKVEKSFFSQYICTSSLSYCIKFKCVAATWQGRSINQSINQSIVHSFIQMSCRYLTRPTQTINQSINRSIDQSIIHSFISCTLWHSTSHCTVPVQFKNVAHTHCV